MIDFAAVADFINSVGFPIAMVAVMGYILYKEQQNHREELNSLKDALNNNTNVMTKVEMMIQDLKDMILGKRDDEE